MPVATVTLRDFRSYGRAAASLDPALTVVHGPNGAGKTNLLEAIYYGLTGRSFRTSNDREVVRFGAPLTRVEVTFQSPTGSHELTVGFGAAEGKRMGYDGTAVERVLDVPERPLVSVFDPDRLGLVKGVPALRRAHLDHVIAALWPSRAAGRRDYSAALAQRNALLGRIRAGVAPPSALGAWDAQLARAALVLMADRRDAVERLKPAFAQMCDLLGLDGDPSIAYRPRSHAQDPHQFTEELQERLQSDLDRGFTGHGPHRDDLVISREGRELRTFGSQGQQRLGLLAMLLAEREVMAESRSAPPLLLLDDVMSELDADRREALVALLRDRPGQTLITTTDVEHVPGAALAGVTRLGVTHGGLLEPISAAA